MDRDWGIEIPGGFFHEGTHTYRDENGTKVLSVTQIFDCLGFIDLSAINPITLEWKRQFGTSVHRAVELLVENDLDFDSCDERTIMPIRGIEERLKQIGYVSQACEERRIYNLNGMKYGGTLDHRGTCIHQGVKRHCIIDLKTSSKADITWRWQIPAYTAGLDRVLHGWLALVLQVNETGKITPHYIDVAAGLKEFQVILATAIIKVNAGLVRIGRDA